MFAAELIFLLVFLMIIIPVLAFDYWGRRLGVGTVHSSRKMRQAIVDEVKDLVAGRSSVEIVDPGCGTGELARQIAKEVPQAKVRGLELSPLPFWIARFKRITFGPENLRFRRKDFHDYSYSATDIVVTFLPEPVLHELEPKLQDDLKPRAIVLSNAFQMPEGKGWKLYRKKLVEKILRRHLYCYQAPACKE